MTAETNYIILLPPSEGKKEGGDETKPYRFIQNLKSNNTFINLSTQREEIYSKLRETIAETGFENLEKVFELKGNNLINAIEITSDLLNKETLKTIHRYNGTMFKYINYSNMDKKSKENFEKSTIFIDGMFGLLKPNDLIPEYKLKITSKFLDINITKFWKNHLSKLFESIFKNKIIIDILPETHRKVITISNNDKYFVIKFCEIKNNKLINLGHESKKLKGEFINYLISFNELSPQILFDFKHSDGFKYSKENSKDNEIIYLKNKE